MLARLRRWFTGCKYGCVKGKPNPDCPYVHWVGLYSFNVPQPIPYTGDGPPEDPTP